jgi:hypothetical protein
MNFTTTEDIQDVDYNLINVLLRQAKEHPEDVRRACEFTLDKLEDLK